MFKIQHLKYVRLGVKLFYLESDLLCLLFGFKYECKSHSGDESLDGTPIHRYLVWSIIASFCRHSLLIPQISNDVLSPSIRYLCSNPMHSSQELNGYFT